MKFGIYLPDFQNINDENKKLPVLFYLSGNFKLSTKEWIQKLFKIICHNLNWPQTDIKEAINTFKF